MVERLLLFVYVHFDTGFKLDDEVVGKYGNLLDGFSNRCIFQFCKLRWLLLDKILQLFEMFKFFLLPMLMSFGFFRLLPQSEDLICNGVVVLMVRCFFNEFLLQLIHAFLNGRWGGCIESCNGHGDIFLHLFDKSITI